MEVMSKYGFCHGWMVDPIDHTEVTCKRREKCAYFDIDFYHNHGSHLEDFEELFPFSPCEYFVLKAGCQIREERHDDEDPFGGLIDYGNT